MPLKRAELLALVIVTISLIGCEKPETFEISEPSLSVACLVFEPIQASRLDTTDTLRAIVKYNAARSAICDE